MSILLSDLNNTVKIVNEQPFDYFSRVSTKIEGRRCVFLSQKKYINQLDDTVSMVITTNELAEEIRAKELNCGFCLTDDPRGQFFNLMIAYEASHTVHQPTEIIDGSKISKNAYISKIGVHIGKNVEIGDHAQILPGTIIKDDVVIQGGAIIGAQLFNTYKYNGKHYQIPQNGKVVINNNVLVGSNSVVAQAMYMYGKTIIGEGTKIDALVSVSHNDSIGKNCLICSGAVLGGYVTVGDDSEIALGAVIKNAVSIGCNAMIGMGSVLLFDAKDGESWFGNPAKRIK